MHCDHCGRDIEDEEITLKMELERVHTNPECEVYSVSPVFLTANARWCLDCVDEYNL